MSNEVPSAVEKARQWKAVMDSERAKDRAVRSEGRVVNHRGVLAVVHDDEIKEDGEWVINPTYIDRPVPTADD
jgi:hypothetical protein